MSSEKSPPGGSGGGRGNKKNAKAAVFPVGPAGKRELKRALVRSTDPGETIGKFQQSHSLHSMMAIAFGTTPRHEASKEQLEGKDDADGEGDPVESLETDSALMFLSHLGVSHYEVHKRIADTLLKQLEIEIRKTQSDAPLLDLLRSCWVYATTITELRPVLWTVLRQLGKRTPDAVLKALAEQDDNGELKHAEIFRPLPPLLKRLVWETDWEDKVPLELVEESDPKSFLGRVKSTLLSHTILPHLKEYCTNEHLVQQANKPFVATVRERRILTTQRRALTTVSTTTTTTASGAAAPGSTSPKAAGTLSTLTKSASTPAGTTSSANAATASTSTSSGMTSGKSISSLRLLLSDAAGGSASFRPKLLYAVLSILIAEHGSLEDNLMGCSDHLHCTLVADLLLSTTGLPKAYQHVLSLATALDDSVKAGILADKAIVKIQACLKEIFPPDAPEEKDAKKAAADGKKKKKAKEKDDYDIAKALNDPTLEPTTAFRRQLSRIVNASLAAMKDADPQSLFLNPVTDAIAPGYSKVISKPMCIMTMEEKIDDHEYNTLQEWEEDVKLMYQNCITYNRGAAGKWFRGECQRQTKVFKEEILPEARRLYQVEVQLRTKKTDDEVSRKRKEPGSDAATPAVAPPASLIVPLPAVYKKVTSSRAAKAPAASEDTPASTLAPAPSMPALASMLLADPFVVRLLLDRVLRSLRLDVIRGQSVPAAHSVVPSLLQLLHMAQWSNHVCAIRGKQYIVPDAGITPPPSEGEVPAEEYLMRSMPYESLRKYLPLLCQLLLENDLDQRVVVGGDLYEAANALVDARPAAPARELWKTSNNIQAIVALVEGALVHICRPGYANEASLSVTYPKFAVALQEVSSTTCDDRAFFLCLIQSLLRHKSKLTRATRDAVVAHWLDYLRTPPRYSKRKKLSKKQKKWGTMTSAAHECLILLLNEWAALGNLLLPRDMLMKFSSDAVEAANESESLVERKFDSQWLQKEPTASDSTSSFGNFGDIRKQYERLLDSLPKNSRAQWKEQVGISDELMEDEAMEDAEKAQEDVKIKSEEGGVKEE